ncbi:SRPBCC family protein [Burkholderia gladioli]|uniref:SRPBCC family protein n=1 Tax=Burkholderia gladioli TaxID=28095 RepID=UPI00163E1C86|nr:SRPBCC family protein [Burkholderia gladioli]
MSNVSISVEIAAPADRVWAIVGKFNGLPAWLAPVRTSRLSADGKTRHLEIGTDTRIVEQLLEHSDADRRYSYSILEGPDPVVDYVATIAVERSGENRAKATWSSRFTPNAGADEAKLIAQYSGLYEMGLKQAKALAEGAAPA